MDGHDPPESAVTMNRNHRSRSTGTAGHDRPEWPVTLVRNTQDATDASREMVASIAEYRADRGKKLNELRLINDLSNLDALSGEQREAAKSFFNVYEGSGKHLRRRDMHVGSLVFSEDAYQDRLPVDHSKPITIHEEHVETQYMAKHARFKGNLDRQAEAKKLDLGNCVVFLIAVPDVNELKRIFADLNK